MNKRIQGLRDRFLNSERKVDIERAMIITEVYRENEEKLQIIKRALEEIDGLKKVAAAAGLKVKVGG